jgi:hypothetical protein
MQAVSIGRSRAGLLAGISLLAVVFTVALTFATLQLPRILGSWRLTTDYCLLTAAYCWPSTAAEDRKSWRDNDCD